MRKGESKKNWQLNSSAFQRLLDWLDAGKNSGGESYLQMRERLIAYFDRKNCRVPEDLADETLNRAARRLEEAGAIESESPAKYCYITARFVFMESLRRADTKNISLDNVLEERHVSSTAAAAANYEREKTEAREIMLDCLERCLTEIGTESRETIIGYYYGEERIKIENRRARARELGISPNALSIRACRIRDKLEACVKKCRGEN